MRFQITEDDLTAAIFDGCSLESTGSGTRAEAREQARVMLAANKLLESCYAAVGAYKALQLLDADKQLPGFEHCYAELKTAIEAAEKGEQQDAA